MGRRTHDRHGHGTNYGQEIVLICPKNSQPHQHELWGEHDPWAALPASIFKAHAAQDSQHPLVISYAQCANAVPPAEIEQYQGRCLTLNHFIPVIPDTGVSWTQCCHRTNKAMTVLHPAGGNCDRAATYESRWAEILGEATEKTDTDTHVDTVRNNGGLTRQTPRDNAEHVRRQQCKQNTTNNANASAEKQKAPAG